MGPSGIPPGAHSARGVALMGGSAARCAAIAIVSPSSAPRLSTGPVFVLPKCAPAGEAARLRTTTAATDVAPKPLPRMARVYGSCAPLAAAGSVPQRRRAAAVVTVGATLHVTLAVDAGHPDDHGATAAAAQVDDGVAMVRAAVDA